MLLATIQMTVLSYAYDIIMLFDYVYNSVNSNFDFVPDNLQLSIEKWNAWCSDYDVMSWLLLMFQLHILSLYVEFNWIYKTQLLIYLLCGNIQCFIAWESGTHFAANTIPALWSLRWLKYRTLIKLIFCKVIQNFKIRNLNYLFGCWIDHSPRTIPDARYIYKNVKW